MKSKEDCAPMTTFEITLHLCDKQSLLRLIETTSLPSRAVCEMPWFPNHGTLDKSPGIFMFACFLCCPFALFLISHFFFTSRGVGEKCEEQLLSKSISDTGQAWQGLKCHIQSQAFCTGSWIQVSYPTSLISSSSSEQPCSCFVAITLHLCATNNGCLLPAGLVLIFSQALLKKRNFWNDYGL